MNTYIFKGQRGVTDLKGQLGDMATEWWTEEDWRVWNLRQPVRERFNRMYVAWLKRHGRYGEEYELSISIAHNPAFDEPELFPGYTAPFSSYKMVFLDSDT